jgi:hypothetical protein
MKSIEKQIVSRIYGKGRGWCFTPRNFLDIGGRSAIDLALSRLAKKGTIRRLARGLYDYPRKHPKIGPLAANPSAIARALTDRDSARLQPSGAYAANLLGLSEQVPAKIVFLTEGPTRSVRIGTQEIALRNTTPRNMATAGRTSGTVVQALRHVGKSQVSEEHVTQLRKALSQEEKRQLKRDKIHAPGWMHPIIDRIAGITDD